MVADWHSKDGRRLIRHVHRQSQTLPLGTLWEIIAHEAWWTFT